MTDRQYSALGRPFGRERGPRIVLTGLALFVLVAIVKPWPGASDRRPDASGTALAPPTASPSRGPSEAPIPTPTAEPNTMACLAGDVEQIVTLERSVGRKVQSWIASVDEVAPDPLALHVAPISIFSVHVIGFGVCAVDPGGLAAGGGAGGAAEPGSGQAATIVDVREETGPAAATTLVDLGAPIALAEQSGGVAAARLYGPPAVSAVASSPAPGRTPAAPAPGPSGSIEPGAWPPGSYAIGFTFPSDRPGTIRWIRVVLAAGAGGPG
jgi:hypothetical protein